MRLLTLDIETKPMTLRGFGLRDQNFGLEQIIDPGGMLCFAARWEGEKKVHFHSAWGDGEKAMIRRASEFVDEADAVIGWNSQRFDSRWIQAQLARFGLGRTSPFTNVDLMRSAKHYFYLPSYKLAFVAQFLGVGAKLDTGGFTLWNEVMDGDAAACRLMQRYNVNDVKLTSDVFARMLAGGWVRGLPNHAIDGGHVCPHCDSERLQRRGYQHSKTRRYARFQCRDCGGWSQATASEPGGAKIKAVA